jgi:hypothetical protein
MRSSGETRWLWRFAVFTALLTTLPYLVAFARAGTEWEFTGFLLAVDDGNSYIAKMLSGTHGAWTFRTPYTTYPQGGLFGLFLPYLLLGKLAGGVELHLQLVALFHLFRIAGVLVYVFAVYDFLAVFTERVSARRLGTVLAAFGGGVGWLLVLAGQGNLFGDLPLDFYSPEAFGFLGLFVLPHLAVGRALILWGFAVLLGREPGSGLWTGLRAGLLWLAAGLFNPLAPAIALLVSGLYVLLLVVRPGGAERPGVVRNFGAAAMLALPPVIFNAGATLLDPFFREWSAQNTILSPHPLHYLAAYAIYLPWAYRGARRLLAGGGLPGRLPVIWVLAVPIMVYLPVNLQRRLAEGVFVALLALFVVGLDAVAVRGRPPRHLVPLGVAAVLTTLLLLAGAGRTAWYPAEPAFRPAAETEAFGYLAEAAPPGSVVLAPVPVGNALPAFAPVRVVIGHGPESIGFERLRPQVEAFFEGRLTGPEAVGLLVEQGVDYVFWPGAVVPPAPGLEPLYVNGEVTIFEYRPP